MTRALVTGGGGFLGRAIVRQLLAQGDEVTVFSRRTFPDLEALGLPPLHMISTNVSDLYGTFYPAFSESGTYRVVVHAIDEEGLTAEPQVVEIQTGLPFKVYLPLVLK